MSLESFSNVAFGTVPDGCLIDHGAVLCWQYIHHWLAAFWNPGHYEWMHVPYCLCVSLFMPKNCFPSYSPTPLKFEILFGIWSERKMATTHTCMSAVTRRFCCSQSFFSSLTWVCDVSLWMTMSGCVMRLLFFMMVSLSCHPFLTDKYTCNILEQHQSCFSTLRWACKVIIRINQCLCWHHSRSLLQVLLCVC